jgi:aromatic ring-opening dioxygenase catalytic subunit (LigB family)
MSATRLPAYFLSHGGGPWPWMKAEAGSVFDRLEASLLAIRAELGDAPRAVLMISGHWETPQFAVSSGARPGMLYDYYGFPEHLYHIKYEAPGSPELAARVRAALQAGGVECGGDPERGFDHGTFSLMKPLYPDADMPVVQLSLKADLDPAAHIAVGRLLAPLRDEGVLIIGSGLSFHNLRLRDARTRVSCSQPSNWTQAPAARLAHPREDHLLPLMTVVGAAEHEAGACVYHQDDFMGTWSVSSFRFGAPPQLR